MIHEAQFSVNYVITLRSYKNKMEILPFREILSSPL